MILKSIKTIWECFRNRSSRYIHAKGCTLSVAENVNYLSAIGKIGNPNFDSRLLIPVNIAYWQMRAKRLLNRFFWLRLGRSLLLKNYPQSVLSKINRYLDLDHIISVR